MRGTFANGFKQRGIGILCTTARRIEIVNNVVSQRFKFGMLVGIAEVLEVSKANKAWCRARHDGSGFNFFTAYLRVRPGQTQSACGRNTQTVHGF